MLLLPRYLISKPSAGGPGKVKCTRSLPSLSGGLQCRVERGAPTEFGGCLAQVCCSAIPPPRCSLSIPPISAALKHGNYAVAQLNRFSITGEVSRATGGAPMPYIPEPSIHQKRNDFCKSVLFASRDGDAPARDVQCCSVLGYKEALLHPNAEECSL